MKTFNWRLKLVGTLCVVLMGATIAQADQVILDDLIVDGSSCIGAGCEDGEEFGFNTLVLKEEDVRINFTDTSNSSSFPTMDWNIIANDSEEGGENYFVIEDENGGQDFRIDPSDNTFHIKVDTVEVGRADDLRRVSNVADGVDATDAATIGQLQPVKDSLDAILDAGTNQGVFMVDLQDRMDQAETDIATNRSDIDVLQTKVEGLGATGDGDSVAASASGEGSTAFGAGASAKTRDTAIGFNATVTADGSVSVGADSQVDSLNSVAIGADSQVAANADGSTALGQNAQINSGATGSVALGQNSVASEANTVSVGSTGNERRITNVADAVNATDAVTLGQLQAVEAGMQGNFNSLNRDIKRVEQRLDQVGAMVSAFSALVPNPHDDSKTQISLGIGHYSGANAMAAGVFHYPSDNILVNSGVSTSFDTNTTAGRAGITFGW